MGSNPTPRTTCRVRSAESQQSHLRLPLSFDCLHLAYGLGTRNHQKTTCGFIGAIIVRNICGPRTVKKVDSSGIQSMPAAASLLRMVLGMLLMLSPAVYFGYYHSVSEPYIQGVLWGYKLPTGYVGFVFGILVALHPWIPTLQKLRLGRLLVMAGASLVSILVVQSALLRPELFVNAWHGTSFSDLEIDIDQYGIGFWSSLALSIVTMVVGLTKGPKVIVLRSRKPVEV